MDSTKNLLQIIQGSKTFVIVTHKRPDGDAISSSLAMFWYLIDIGKEISDIDVIIPEFMNDFCFIPGIEHLKKSPTKEKYDVAIVVDCANLQLLAGSSFLKQAKQIICLDHHEKTSLAAACSIIDSASPSCTCILYEIFNCTDLRFLNCIAIGLISDTCNLSLHLTKQGENIIEALTKSGVDIPYFLKKLSSQNARTLELVQLVKERGYWVSNTGIFCSYLLQKDLLDSEKTLNTVNHKAIIVELEKLVKYTSLILLIENDKGEFKGSLRTFDTRIDLNQVCSQLVLEGKLIKGGGHSYSSGCTAIGIRDDVFLMICSKILENYY